jgi:thioredoxin 1
MREINSDEFKEEVQNAEATIIDFYTDWCGPCKRLIPVLEEIAEQHRVFKINAESCPELCVEYGVTSVPTLLFFKDGTLINKAGGIMSKTDILEKIQ